jgi:hypothetical protein
MQFVSLALTIISLFMGSAVLFVGLFSRQFNIPFMDALQVLGSGEFYKMVFELHDGFLIACYCAAGIVSWWFSVIRLTPDAIKEYADKIRKDTI